VARSCAGPAASLPALFVQCGSSEQPIDRRLNEAGVEAEVAGGVGSLPVEIIHAEVTLLRVFCMGVLLLFFDECPNWHVKLLVDGARRWMRLVTNDCSDFIRSTLRSSLTLRSCDRGSLRYRFGPVRSGELSSNDGAMLSKRIHDWPYHSFSGPRRMMTTGLKWGVLAGLIAGVVAIVLVDLSGIHGPLGGLIAAGVTGVVIWIVSHRIERPRDGSRDR